LFSPPLSPASRRLVKQVVTLHRADEVKTRSVEWLADTPVPDQTLAVVTLPITDFLKVSHWLSDVDTTNRAAVERVNLVTALIKLANEPWWGGGDNKTIYFNIVEEFIQPRIRHWVRSAD